MYRLLMVTDDAGALERLSAMTGWEAMGYKPPHLRSTAQEAMECLQRHYVDAIAVARAPALEPLVPYLNQRYPHTPLFEVADTQEGQRAVLKELSNVLTRLSADDSNDEYDLQCRFEQQRERWLRKVIAGVIPTEADICRQFRLYRCRADLSAPCVLVRLELPQDDSFFSERWHYGSERLETALRNFFGTQRDHMLIHVAVISPQEARVLCYPADAQADMSENAILAFVQETVEQVDHYVGLRMRVLEARHLSGLVDFAADKAVY